MLRTVFDGGIPSARFSRQGAKIGFEYSHESHGERFLELKIKDARDSVEQIEGISNREEIEIHQPDCET